MSLRAVTTQLQPGDLCLVAGFSAAMTLVALSQACNQPLLSGTMSALPAGKSVWAPAAGPNT